MKNSPVALVLAAIIFIAPAGAENRAPVLQAFHVKDHLSHRWEDEMIHFDFDVAATDDLALTNAEGQPVPAQFKGVKRDAKRSKGQVWTVVSLPPDGEVNYTLRRGKASHAGDLKLAQEGEFWVLANSKMALRLPRWPGVLKTPQALASLAAPVVAVRGRDKAWLGEARWYDDSGTLKVARASTTIRENGPIRAIIEQRVVFTDGKYHLTTVELGARQEAAIIHEDSNIDNPRAGWRLSMQPGLEANRVFWNNQHTRTANAESDSLANTAPKFDKESTVAKLRPWGFWWLGDITLDAGFYNGDSPLKEQAPFVAVLMLHPSRWTPGDWDGLERLEIPIKASPGGKLTMDFGFLATTAKDAPSKPQIIMRDADPSHWSSILAQYKDVFVPLHREWAITVGTVAEHVRDVKTAMEKLGAGDPNGVVKMRRQLLKYGEYPLDKVKDYGFDFKPAQPRKSPFLLINEKDIARTRRLARDNFAVKAQVEAAKRSVASSGAIADFQANGAVALRSTKYDGSDYNQKLMEAYLGSDDPIYGKLLTASVTNLTYSVRRVFLEVPQRPGLASYGPWQAEEFSRLLFAYDLVAGRGLLTAREDKAARNSLVFGAQTLNNSDYWDLSKGLASANPNMTGMIRLPLGLIGLYLAGHPQADEWAGDAEAELKHELDSWIGPNGAWIECPGYQGTSLDGMTLFGTALRNVHGRDLLNTPRFKMLMEYFGYLLTPRDPRLAPRVSDEMPTMSAPGTLPSSTLVTIGDTPLGNIFPFNGWMAALTAASDPQYSARQQFYWQLQNYHLGSGNRARGLTASLTNAALPAQPPTVLSRGFPGFGSIMRNSWTDPKASFLAHRTGHFAHHYHDDFNSFVYYAKGVPLCLDFGNQYVPFRREEPWFHNRVSFNIKPEAKYEDNWKGTGGELREMKSLPSTVDYSYGKSFGRDNEEDHRYLLMVKSADPLGANYVVMRDRTRDGKQTAQPYFWNLWCLSGQPQTSGNTVHFPGQYGVDLDVHMLSPRDPQFSTDHWQWQDQKQFWGQLKEEQYGIRVPKIGSAEDYLAVLYPRAPGQAEAKITALADGAAMRIDHMEGSDVVLLSPDKPSQVHDGEIELQGQIAFARKYTNEIIRLAVVRGQSSARCGGWSIASSGAVSVEIQGGRLKGESAGEAHEVRITLPAKSGQVAVTLDGKLHPSKREGQTLVISLPLWPPRVCVTMMVVH